MEMEAVKKTFDSRIEKVLLKLRKKATSALSIKAVTDALMALGYTVERENAWYELTRHEIRERGKGKSAREKNGIDWWANGSRDIRIDRNTYHPDEMAGVEANFRLRDASESDTERRLANLRVALKTAADLTVESLPEKVKVDRIVTTHIGEIFTKAKRYGVEHRFEWTAWIGRPAIDVTCPEGKTYRHFPRDESDYVLYGWLTKERTSAIKQHAEVVVAHDHMEPRIENGNDMLYANSSGKNFEHYRTGNRTSWYRGIFRHSVTNSSDSETGGRLNCLWLDGHVTTIKETLGTEIPKRYYDPLDKN